MSRKHKLLLFGILALCMYACIVNLVFAWDYEFPRGLTVVVPDGREFHFGDAWVNTTGTAMHISNWRTNNWINYTVDGAGIQFIGFPASIYPSQVFLDGVERTAGDGWTYTNPLNISGAIGAASIFYGAVLHGAAGASILVSGENITIRLEDGYTLDFTGHYNLNVEVIGGFWNATNCNITITAYGGSIDFNAQNNAILELSTDTYSPLNVNVANAVVSETSTNVHSVTFTSGNNRRFAWNYRAISIVDNYFMLGVGLAGIFLIVAAPTWWALMFVKNGLDEDTTERIGYAMLMIVFGFGLLVTWLW